jgi:hypothetical protein
VGEGKTTKKKKLDLGYMQCIGFLGREVYGKNMSIEKNNIKSLEGTKEHSFQGTEINSRSSSSQVINMAIQGE